MVMGHSGKDSDIFYWAYLKSVRNLLFGFTKSINAFPLSSTRNDIVEGSSEVD